MLFTEVEEGERKNKMLKTIERIKKIGDCDLFSEFKKDYPEITITLKEFSELIDNMAGKGEIKWQ